MDEIVAAIKSATMGVVLLIVLPLWGVSMFLRLFERRIEVWRCPNCINPIPHEPDECGKMKP